MNQKIDPRDDLRAHLLELYARYLKVPSQPADQFLGGYLRRRSEVRGSARNFIGAVFFSLLRHRVSTLLLSGWDGNPDEDGCLLVSICPREEEALRAVTRWLRQDMGLDVAEVRRCLTVARDIAASRPPIKKEVPLQWPAKSDVIVGDMLRAIENPGAVIPEELCELLGGVVPPWLHKRWASRFGKEIALGVGWSMGAPAPLDLRVNTDCLSREELLRILDVEEIPATATPWSPDGIRLKRKVNLTGLQERHPGAWEVQDEASQLVSHCIGDLRGLRVLDACAGAGGKALHLAALVGGEGRVFAHDIDGERLSRIAPRIKRAGVGNIMVLDPGDAASAGPYDAVLIDAPCLGLGRLRRDPVATWRGPFNRMLEETCRAQAECLRLYAPLVRPGGVLVYATCSFEEEETVGQLSGITGFEPAALPAPLNGEAFQQTRSADGSSVVLLPSLHGPDGFFIGRMRRI
ncbi:MAG: RsmB/NOP family class I SAM-dependent RNA methyltransferase [Candidatus Sumerlaeia bacterium]|nr:RsmB/NOP family class I SAM-dependent RNA methyltransferase [Candidatus Sumerlaeia bacterium]